MKKITFHGILLGCSFLFLIALLAMILSGKFSGTGHVVIGLFLCLVISVRGFKATKSFSYTVWIFTAVAASMYYPNYSLRLAVLN